jgi:VanZ family protein
LAIAEIGCSPPQNGYSSRVPKLERFLVFWLPPLAWMVLIFSASADARSYQHSSLLFVPMLNWLFPRMSVEHVEMIHHMLRKCGHLTEFAILALLFWRAIHHTRRPPITTERNDAGRTEPKHSGGGRGEPKQIEGGWHWDEAGLALSFVFLYAASDEFHQIFVPSRTPLVSDVFIDTAGGTIGLLFIWILGKVFKRW